MFDRGSWIRNSTLTLPLLGLISCRDAARTTEQSSASATSSPGKPLSSPPSGGAPARPPSGRVIVKLRPTSDQALTRATTAGGAVDVAAAGAANQALAGLLTRHRVRAVAPVYAGPQQVKRQGGSEAQIVGGVRQRFAMRSARASNAAVPDLGGRYVLDLGPRARADFQRELQALRGEPEVVYAEEDRPVKANLVPNDPQFGSLYGMSKISAPAAWDSATGAGVVVAVVDTGVDYAHPDLDANIWTNTAEIPGNGLDDDGNGLVDDVRGWDFVGADATSPLPDNDPMDHYGHGTHVAGTIAAEGNNGLGVIGVAWQAKIMVLRGLDDSGLGYDSTLAAAIRYAADKGADVINASWGGEGTSQTLQDAIDYAHGLGALFVAAAGNSSKDATNFHPANAPNAIAVSATDDADALAGFSNFGSKIDVAAPGVNILSLQMGTGGYVQMSGTSMATPHVSGVAALIIGAHPTFTNEQVRQVLRASADDLGAPGKDPSYGYGRINAAQAVSFTSALEAKISAPADGAEIRGPVTITGWAQGPNFARYLLAYAPVGSATFTSLADLTTPVNGAALGTFDPFSVPDGLYTVRLWALDTNRKTFNDQIQVKVAYTAITVPAPPPVPNLEVQLKPGGATDIHGRAMGPSFQSFKLEWAPGRNATSGWSTAGITNAGGGSAPVLDSVLGSWIPPAGAAGEHTIRVTVANNGFSSWSTSVVYLEPDLASSHWPVYVGVTANDHGPLPARMPDGSTRLILCGYAGVIPPPCHSVLATDPSVTSEVRLDGGSLWPPSAGDLDGLAGDEVVFADRHKLKVFRADLVPIREITITANEIFGIDRVQLADLDGDGRLEILALARQTNDDGLHYQTKGSLYVFRGDGTPFSTNYPVAIGSPQMPNGYDQIDVVTTDLNGDRRKEILLAVTDADRTLYEVQAFNGDGTRMAGWPTPTFPTNGAMASLATADLDHDGSPEILATERRADAQFQVRLLDARGVTRPGWPVAGTIFAAVSDLDRDGVDEVVVQTNNNLSALRLDGSSTGLTSPIANVRRPVVADVDGDGYPEILFTTQNLALDEKGTRYNDVRLNLMSRTGTLLKQWVMSGAMGQQAWMGTISVGDFDGDGRTDFSVHTPVVQGGGELGVVTDGVLTMLSNRQIFDPLGADWPLVEHDAQNSRSRPLGPSPTPVDRPPVILGGPTATPAVVRGLATTLAVQATDDKGEALLHYTWATTGTPPAAVAFSANGTNAAKTTSATFTKPGAYGVQVTVTDGLGHAAVGTVLVTVAATVTSIAVTPTSATVLYGASQAFSASARDQFGAPLSPQPAFTWAVSGGQIDQSGLFTALAVGGPFTITASSGTIKGTAQVTVVTTLTNTFGPAADAYVRDGSYSTSNYGTAGVLNVKNSNSTTPGNTRITFLRFPISGLAGTVTGAKLRLYGQRPVASTVVDSVYAVSDLTWNEKGITFDNKPALGTKQPGGIVVGTTTKYWEWSVTGYVQAQKSAGAITLAVQMDGKLGDGAEAFNSRESGSNTPQLVVTASNAPPPAVTLTPIADAYVQDGTPTTNYGTATALVVKNSSDMGKTRIAYLRFSLASVGAVGSAKLRLYGSRPGASTSADSVWAVANTSWIESGTNSITWATRPPTGLLQAATVIGATAKYYEWDLTAYVKAQQAGGAGALSVAVQMNDPQTDSPDSFNSKDATSNRPQLVVTAP
jgi:subtilisin family serine protease